MHFLLYVGMTDALPPLCKGEQYQTNRLFISQPQAPYKAMVHPLCQHPMYMVHPLMSTF